MQRYLKIALGFYLLATTLGVLLRVQQLEPFRWLVFPFGVHAHSHTLYFGWVGLALFALLFQQAGATGRVERGTLAAIALASAANFASFLHGGYSRLSIIISSVSLFIWLGAAVIGWRSLRRVEGIERGFLRAGLFYIGLAGLGAAGRVVLVVTKTQDPRLASLSVFAFLHNFAWFFLFTVMGLLIARRRTMRLSFNDAQLRRSLAIMTPLAWLTFPLGVMGGGEGLLGMAARLAAAVLVYPSVLWLVNLWRAARTSPYRTGLRWTAVWFAGVTVMEAAGVLGLAERAVAARNPAILYLHVLLLGFVTLMLALLIAAELRRPAELGVALHTTGLVAMCAGLAIMGAPSFGLDFLGPWYRVGMLLATTGGVGAVAAGVAWLWPVRRVEMELKDCLVQP